MKLPVLAVILATAVAVPAHARSHVQRAEEPCGCVERAPEASIDPVRLEMAKVLVDTLSPRERVMSDFADSMRRSARIDQMTDVSLRSSANTQFDVLLAKVQPVVERHFEDTQNADARAYARIFTSAELKAATAFAATAEGRTVLSRSFELIYDDDVERAKTSLMTDLIPALQDFQVAMCKQRTAARLAAGDKKAKCSLG